MTNGPHISYVERHGDLLVITFRDGSCALYTAELLYATLPQAIQILDEHNNRKRHKFEDLPTYEERWL